MVSYHGYTIDSPLPCSIALLLHIFLLETTFVSVILILVFQCLDTFSVMCYNVLCDKYCTAQLYGYCPSWALSWEYRKTAILKEILHYSADIVSLQVRQLIYNLVTYTIDISTPKGSVNFIDISGGSFVSPPLPSPYDKCWVKLYSMSFFRRNNTPPWYNNRPCVCLV